jgi:hypothetical protein
MKTLYESIMDLDSESKIEFAVPVNKFETNYLISYELDKEHHKKIQNQEDIEQSSALA